MVKSSLLQYLLLSNAYLNFEIIGDITNLVTLFVNSNACVKLMVQDGGGNLKALQPLAKMTEVFMKLSYTGMKSTELVRNKLK
ncbi:hypothetical protein [Nostoc sp.]|uniref:hypothetical protein n=1 Tax=Nostoc sp. TaxID=1180 RepID=UPI002FFC535D